jgi:hypothetical protein
MVSKAPNGKKKGLRQHGGQTSICFFDRAYLSDTYGDLAPAVRKKTD